MKRTEHNSAARRQGELTRDRGSLRLSPAIDARRRLNTRRADSTRTKIDPLGPSDPRYAYLTKRTTRRATRIELDDQEQIKEITVVLRPRPGPATLTATLTHARAAGRRDPRH
jgi:hypothetical protein